MLQNTAPKGTKTIYIIRHGQTDFNKQGIVQGSGVDTDLNETGILQAQHFFSCYRDTAFEKIYISGLKRTKQTVLPFKEKNIPIQVIAELNEINWGRLEGAQPTEENHRAFVDTVNAWRNGYLDIAIAGGETPEQLFARQKMGLAKIEAQTDEKLILLCMHGRAMRSFLCLLTGTALRDMDEFEHGNVCLYVLEKRPQEEHYRILVRNNRNHLHNGIH